MLVQVGTDPRLSGPDLMDAIIVGLARCAPLPLRVASSRPSHQASLQRWVLTCAPGPRHHARLLHELYNNWCGCPRFVAELS